MNLRRHLTRCLPGLSALVLAGAASTGWAQTTNYLIDQFDTDTSSSYANQGWGTAAPIISWDSSANQSTSLGPNNAGSGAALWQVDWSASNGGDQFMVQHWFGETLDLRSYTNISFDIRFAPSSATDGNGSFGNFEIDWVPQSDGWASTAEGSYTFAATNTGWIHVSFDINASANTKLQAVNGLGFKMQQKKTGTSLSGTTQFWLDNLILGARSTPLPPPTLSVSPARVSPGLMMVACGGGNEYNRTLLRTQGTYYSWLGYPDQPVTFSTTIASYPDNNHAGFQSVIFLVPGSQNDPSIDWDAPNVVELAIVNQADGTAIGSFQYKTNQPQDNAMYSGAGHLADIHCPSPLGRWSITFLNDTNVTMSGPGGVSTNFNFPDAVALQSLFQNPLSAYYGNQQGGANNAGQGAVYSEFAATNFYAGVDFVDNFTNLDTTVWQVVCSQPNDIFTVDASARYWVGWSLPDTGFSLRASPNLSAGSWVDPGMTNLVTTSLGNRVLVTSDKLPSAGKGFFRLVK